MLALDLPRPSLSCHDPIAALNGGNELHVHQWRYTIDRHPIVHENIAVLGLKTFNKCILQLGYFTSFHGAKYKITEADSISMDSSHRPHVFGY